MMKDIAVTGNRDDYLNCLSIYCTTKIYPAINISENDH